MSSADDEDHAWRPGAESISSAGTTLARHKRPGAMSQAHAAYRAALAVRKRRRRRVLVWMRRGIFSVLTVCLLVALTLWLVTRSWFIVWQLRPVLERKLGGEVTIGQAKYQGNGRVTFSDLALKARDLKGPAAEIARIGRADVHVDLASLLSGSMTIMDAELADVMLRISEDVSETGRMNVMALHPQRGTKRKPLPAPPRVRLTNLTLEVGTHVDDQFLSKGRRRLAGEMHSVPSEDQWFAYELAEVDDHGQPLGADGLFIKGDWNPQTTECHSRIESIVFDERVNRMLPRQAQLWWNLMQLEGRVDGVMIDWHPDMPLSVSFSVKDIALTIPIDLEEVWGLYRNGAVEPTTSRPRMNVHTGQIRVGTDSLVLDQLTGELGSSGKDERVVGVPYEISLNVPHLPPIDWKDPERWMQEALKTSAFELTARLDNFSLKNTEGGDAQAVGLPTIVARTLEKFQTTNWVLSTSVHVGRAEPTVDGTGARRAAPLQVAGQAYINNAIGRYHKFPYLLEDVDAYLHFDNKRVNVEYLQARGSDGSTFRITGYIEPPDKDAKFHMDVTGMNVPLDDRLRAALKPNELKAFDALFNHRSAESMARAGLLPDEANLAALSRQRDDAMAQLAQRKGEANADPAAIARLEHEIARLDRSIQARPFKTGGVVDVQLSLDRPLGPQQPTNVRGEITIKSVGLIFDRFPYPMRAVGGKLKWEGDRVVIDSGADGLGVRFVTPAGGAGSLTGMVEFPKSETGRKVQPDVTLVINDDPPNPALFAAIPFSKNELDNHPELAHDWPGLARSRGGRIVEGIGLSGEYDYRGHIGKRDDGKMDWDFHISMDGGAATPITLLAQSLNARGLPWPEGFTLSDLSGEVRVQRESVSWESVSGAHEQTVVSTSGLINMGSDVGESSNVSVQLTNAPIMRSALNMISEARARTVEALWDRYQPEGRIDAVIAWHDDAPPDRSATMVLQPREVTLAMGDERATLKGRGGEIEIDGAGIAFRDLSVDVASPAAPDAGTLDLRGTWTFTEPAACFSLAGQWQRGRLESPLIPEVLRAIGAQEQATRYAAFNPAGAVDLTFDTSRPDPGMPVEYDLAIQPQTLEFTLRDRRVHMEIASGSVSVVPGLLTLEQLTGQIGKGAFTVDGDVSTTEPLDATLTMDYRGPLTGPEVSALLPTTVSSILTALEFRDGAPGRLENGKLHLRHSADNWQTEFTGRLHTRGASFVAGLQFTNVDGSLDIDVAHETGRPMRLAALARASRAVILGQELTDVEAPITVNDAGDALVLPAVQARSNGGAVAASAIVGMGERRDYQVRLDIAGVPLGDTLAVKAEKSTRPNVESDDGEAAVGEEPKAESRSPTAESPTGQMYASISLEGLRGEASSKRGRGIFRVLNGRISSIPLLLHLAQVMQLTLPLSGGIDFADADIYIVGDTAHFERILFESTVGKAAMLQLIGEGTLDLTTMEVAARFRSRSGLVGVRDVVGFVSDRLFEIEITGPLRDPKARIVPLP